eukprot:452982_1
MAECRSIRQKRTAPPPDPYVCKRTAPPTQWQNQEHIQHNKYISQSPRYMHIPPTSSTSSRNYQQHNHNDNYDMNLNHHRYHHVDENQEQNKKLTQWTQLQNRMRKNLRTQNVFEWEVPQVVSMEYYTDNCGRITNCGIVRISHQMRRNQNPHNLSLRHIGAMDISSTKKGVFPKDKACAGLFIFSYPSMRCVYQETLIVTLEEPYVPGFLAFREVEPLKRLVNDLMQYKPEMIPDVILVDGHGIFHYRRAGLATHLSMEINIPCIGVAKNPLNVDKMDLEELCWGLNRRLCKTGEFEQIFAPKSNDVLGYGLRSNSEKNVIFVSPGNLISYESSIKLVMLCMDRSSNRFNLPMPIGKVRFRTRCTLREYREQHAPRCNKESHRQLVNENMRIKDENKRLKWIEQQHQELQLRYHEISKEYQRLKFMNGIDYECWNYQQIADWIGYIEHGKFKKYKTSLLTGMKQEKIDGTYLGKLDIHDILRWGVDNFEDRHKLMVKIRELLVKNSTTKGNDDHTQVEGS